jgi:phosphoenolpyruvate synthase/pyruvate phosphate dikinase
MTLKQTLLELKKLMKKWEISIDEWFLMLHYSDMLQGYNLKYNRDNHLHIMVTKEKFPWQFRQKDINSEIPIPQNSKLTKDFEKFIKTTGYDFHIIVGGNQLFSELKKHSIIYKIQKEDIRMTTTIGSLIYNAQRYPTWKKKFSKEVINRRLEWIELICQRAKEKGDRKVEEMSKMIVDKYKIKDDPRETKELLDNFRKHGIIKGRTANRGNATGKVFYIKNPDRPPKLKRNCILVSKLTSPKLVPYMRTAKAIITDEGGVASHAAIISRELNKPCIIGTKIATKVLKDGDEVEVNANNGIVKIIK